MQKRTRVLTGLQPTGLLHLGNYFGAIRPAVEFSHSADYEVIFLCPDWHGLTNKAKIALPGKMTHSLIATYLAMGFNLSNNAIILQSDFPQIQENSWYLACTSSAGLLERAHAYKDAVAAGKEATAGLLFYPALMAADIMTFDAQLVPVGKDQSQHLEYASDMAKHFNNAVQAEVFLEPKGVIQDVPLLQGTDGRKMSKSYNNTIPMFASKKDLEKIVKEIKTDSKGLNDPKDPQECLIFLLLKSFASAEAIAYMKERLEKGANYGYGHAKQDFIAEHERVFGSKRELYEHYLENPKEVYNLLQDGYERCTQYANNVTTRARKALGLVSIRPQLS